MKKLAGLALIVLITAAPVKPRQDQSQHSGHTMPDAAMTDATKAYQAANDRMHEAMAVAYSGDADADFVRSMIPHHQGAVEMAKVVLQYGRDPDIRTLAEDIIAAQEKEIAWMHGWLQEKGK